jgi:aminoglycoside phosphotransferase (APT) family kinase protein
MSSSFSSESAYGLLKRASRGVGEVADGASMLRLGENAIFRLAGRSSSVVMRVTRDMTRFEIARRELCMSRWLNGAGNVPAVRVYEEVPDQPVVVDGHPITFWRYEEPEPDAPTVVDLARLLRGLHALAESPCELPTFQPLATVRRRLDGGLAINEADQKFLRTRCDAIEMQLSELEYALPPGPIHGDAHTGNLLGAAGRARLTDFEVSAVGPREWDLVPVAVGVERLGITTLQWDRFVAGYGFDVRTWHGYPLFREIRELGMTTWLAQNVAESGAIASEVALRVQSLRDGDLDRAWTAF